jgi:hypothetical protein
MDRAAALAAQVPTDPILRRAVQELGIETSSLLPLSRHEFELDENDRADLIDMRYQQYERERQQLARELEARRKKLAAKEQRAASASALRTSTSAPAFPLSVSTASHLSTKKLALAKAKEEEKSLQILAKRRQAPSDAWFERKYQQAARSLEAAQKRHEKFVGEHVLAPNATFLEKQDRARSRYYRSLGEARRNEDLARAALEERMEHAAALKRRGEARREGEIRKQREKEEKKQLRLSRSLEKLEVNEERRIAQLQKRFGREDATVRRLQSRRQHELTLVHEHDRLKSASLEERYQRQERVRRGEIAEIVQRHESAEERVRLFMQAKDAESQERRDAALRSSFSRQAIKVNSRGELVNPPIAETNSRWVERLRLVPVPAPAKKR